MTGVYENHMVIANLARSDQTTLKLSLEQVGVGRGGVWTKNQCGQALMVPGRLSRAIPVGPTRYW